jgi:hypothetical protein
MDLATGEADPIEDPMPKARLLLDPIRAELAALPGVVSRRMFGTEAYFTGPVLFAFVAGSEVVLRLPDGPREAALTAGEARPWLGALPAGLSGWVVVPAAPTQRPLILAAHAAARAMARSVARKGRRTGRSVRTAGSDGS